MDFGPVTRNYRAGPGLSTGIFRGDEIVTLASWTCVYASFFTLCHVLLQPLVRRLAIEHKSRQNWINYVLSTVQALVAGIACTRALLSDPALSHLAYEMAHFSSSVDMVHIGSDSPTLSALLPWTLGFFVYDIGAMLLDVAVYERLFVMHHLFSLLVWPVSFLCKAGNFYVIYFLATEVSTPLLNLVVFFFPKHGVNGSLRTIMGVFLIVTFFVFRVLPSPMVLYSLWASWELWRTTVHPVIATVAMMTIPIPPLLFGFWFSKMIHGALVEFGFLEHVGGNVVGEKVQYE